MNAGLYLHVPFCRTRCPFCDFAVTTDRGRVREWLEAVAKEMVLRSESWRIAFDTVYLGGGTPSLLEVEMVEWILAEARSRFRIKSGAEVTLEANPGTMGAGDFARLREAGVNRLSLGVQSFHEEDLVFLGRDHSVKDSLESFRNAREEGFGNVSLDLIYGLPHQSPARWEEVVERAAALRPEHISAYQLTYERGTPLTRRKERGEFRDLSEEESRERFLHTRRILEEAGYRHYEVSSYARREDLESRHNRKYWEGAPYLGLGPSAHSYREGVRSWNTPRTSDYVEALGSGRDPVAGSETLSREEAILERIFLGLRTARGLRLDLFREDFGTDLRETHAMVLAELIEKGLGILEANLFRLTARGLAVADGIAARLGG